MIQIGAYSEFWPEIHMTPEEGMRAHVDLSGGTPFGVMLPIHWGTFNLAPHPWEEPGRAHRRRRPRPPGVRVAVPPPGEPFEPFGELPADPWWRAVAAPAPHGSAPAVPAPGTDAGPESLQRPNGVTA